MSTPAETGLLSKVLANARSHWLNAATVNAGGRWAVVAGLLAAFVGLVAVASGAAAAIALTLVAACGLAGVVAALFLTRRAFARPGRPGAPDFALALDRALGLHDALPTLIETPGPFGEALQARVIAELTPEAVKRAAPPKHFAPLVVALILCLLPLAGLAPDALPQVGPDGPSAAQDQPVSPQDDEPQDQKANEEEPKEGGKSGGTPQGRDGKGQGGQPAPQPTAGEAPKDMPKPQAQQGAPQSPNGVGDEKGPPPEPPKPPENREIETKDNALTPDAEDGETRKEKRSRWMYDPNGTTRDVESRAPKIVSDREMAIPRQRLTAGERKRLEELYDKLYR